MNPTFGYFAGQALGRATFENLDHLLQLEMRPHGMTQGIIPRLYRIARPPETDPLSEQAAKEILRRPDSRIAIFTGLFIPDHMPHGETDGPLGAVVIARAVTTLGYAATIITEPEISQIIREISKSIGYDGVDVMESTGLASEEAAMAFASNFELGIAIEKLGVNARGVRHTVGGNAVTTGDPWAETCISTIRMNGGFTIGIGDNGNEIGFGKIADLIRPLVPRGDMCRCPCRAGIVTVHATDLLIPAAVSNYGGYAIAAALSCLTERPNLSVTADEVELMLRRAIELGSVNGGNEDKGFMGDDGVPLDGARAYATLVSTVAGQFFVRVGDHR